MKDLTALVSVEAGKNEIKYKNRRPENIFHTTRNKKVFWADHMVTIKTNINLKKKIYIYSLNPKHTYLHR